MPTVRFSVTFAELPGGTTRMVIETQFPSAEAMAELTEMGMDEGMAAAMSQIDAILTAQELRG